MVFLINDDWKLALEVGADGAHVGRDDDSLARIRAEAGPDLILGGSSYDDLNRARELPTPAPTTSPSAPCSRPPSSPTPCARRCRY